MASVTEIMVTATFKHHFYKWDGVIRQQKKGAAMGVRASGSLSKVCMDQWIEDYRELLVACNVEVKLLKKYVDDVLVVCINLPLGSRFREGRISQMEADRAEDEARSRSKDDGDRSKSGKERTR